MTGVSQRGICADRVVTTPTKTVDGAYLNRVDFYCGTNARKNDILQESNDLAVVVHSDARMV